MKRLTVTAMLLILILALVGCAGQSGTETPPLMDQPRETRLLLTFVPNVQFAPYYVGIEKGFFEDAGLAVTLEHVAESDVVRLVGTGEVPFGVVSGEQVLLARQQDLPVVYFFEWFQEYPVAVASKAGQDIVTPEDMAGASVGVPLLEGASYIGLEALLYSAGLTDEDIDLQATGFTQVETLVTDRVDAVVVYANNEPIQLMNAGEEINVIYLSDYADLVSNGLITSEEVIEQQPGVVRSMARAMANAVQYTVDNPDEAFEISKQYVEGLDEPETAEQQREVLARSIDLWRPEAGMGHSDLESWQQMQDVLLETGLLEAPLDLEEAFTNEFLP